MHADSDRRNDLFELVIGSGFTMLTVICSGLDSWKRSGRKHWHIVVGSSVSIQALNYFHIMQCTNHLKAIRPRLCLLLDFGKLRLEINRVANGL